MNDFRTLETWRNLLGLLPIHLLPKSDVDSGFLMQNGGHGDFCLDLNSQYNEEECYSLSWSGNTKNFVVLNEDKIKVINWKLNKRDEINIKTISNQYNKFYNLLAENNFKSNDDVVPRIIEVFKTLRTLKGERKSANETLELLFQFLLGIEHKQNSNFDYSRFGIENSFVPSDWEILYENNLNFNPKIQPNLSVILRHSSGPLFQEAQKEVILFENQLSLFGGINSSYKTKKMLYSSIHYTPTYLSRCIVENTLKFIDIEKPNLKIFDPASGSAEFLIETLKQLNEKGYKGTVHVEAWDVSELAIKTSKFILEYEKLLVWNDRLTINLKIVEDSLIENWDDDFDIILMNPPFVSYEQMSSKNRETVKEVLGSLVNGKPNQAIGFLYKSVCSLSNSGGVLGCVIPSSLLTLDAYKKVRDRIIELSYLQLIGKLGNFVFEDALTDVSILVSSKFIHPEPAPQLLWTKNNSGIVQNSLRELRKMYYNKVDLVESKDFSVFRPATFPIIEDNWRPISFQENKLIENLNRFILIEKLTTIGEVFSVKQGIRTGSEVFVIDSIKYSLLPSSEQVFFRPVAKTESIGDGQVHDLFYIWYPYDKDKLLINSEEEFESKVNTYYNMILPNKSALSKRARKSEKNWWILSEHRAWLRSKEPKLISKEFGNSDSFAFDVNGKFAVERGIGWLPKSKFKMDYFYFYLAVFSSNYFDKLLSIYSKQLAGGNWYDFAKKYMDNIPIPNVFDTNINGSIFFNDLVSIGKEISKGKNYYKYTIDDILVKYFYPSDL